jgi:hypothetical protein
MSSRVKIRMRYEGQGWNPFGIVESIYVDDQLIGQSTEKRFVLTAEVDVGSHKITCTNTNPKSGVHSRVLNFPSPGLYEVSCRVHTWSGLVISDPEKLADSAV